MDFFNFTIMDLLMISIGMLLLIFFIYASVVSLFEKEQRAANYFLISGLIISIPMLIIGCSNFEFKEILEVVILAIIVIAILIFLIPIRFRNRFASSTPVGKIDERDTMFSRNELKTGTKNYNDYYIDKPGKQKVDDNIKSNPGLLNSKAVNHHPAMFMSSNASFFTIDALKSKVDGDVSEKKYVFSENDITTYIKKWAVKLGALNVGITELKDYHIYSYRGRKGNYNDKVELNHKFAIAFTVEMDFDNVRSGPLAPIVMESAQQYLTSGAIAVQIAEFIRGLGYPALAHIDGNYEVVCPLVARDAGLGEIGRMGLLMTPKHGPRVRLGVVTTDLPLVVDESGHNSAVIEFCTNCRKCAEVCPSKAISLEDQKDIGGVKRWQINQESCFELWTKFGTDCGRCMSVCPYSHPDNFLHNIVRFGIQNSSIFSRIALNLDDVIYGKKPIVKQPPTWMKIKELVN